MVGIGGVFRDSNGAFLGGFYHSAQSIGSARYGELLALLFGVSMAQTNSLTPVLVESQIQLPKTFRIWGF